MSFLRVIASLLLLLASSLSASSPVCFFQPPDKWQVADPDAYSPLVKVGFVGPATQGFCPSINLAIEKVDCSLREYLEAVKKIHKTNRHKDWSYLGTFTTLSGEAALTQIDLTSPSGPMRMLQLILIKDGTAYILTAAALKKEFVQLLPTLRKAFHSLQVTEDLYSTIRNDNQRLRAQQLFEQAKNAVSVQNSFLPEMSEWQTFQDFILAEFTDLGPYWQALTVSQGYQQLQSLASATPMTSNQNEAIPMEIVTATNETVIEKKDMNIEACLASVEASLALIKSHLDNFTKSLSPMITP